MSVIDASHIEQEAGELHRSAEARADDSGWVTPPPVQLADGTHIQLYKDGQSLKASFDAISRAQYRVGLEFYIFRSDATGLAFVQLLCQKAREGVKVYVIYDSFGSIKSDPKMFQQMRRAGVRLAEFHPIWPWNLRFGWRPFNRNHRKLVVVDDYLASMGGLNIGSEYAGATIIRTEKCDHMRDNGIGIVGRSARLLHTAFARSWRYVQQGGRIRKAELIHDIDHGEFGLLAAVPTLSSPLLPFLKRFFRSAQKSILLTMAYFVPDDALLAELTVAARRGVSVRIMLGSRYELPLLHSAAEAYYDRLLNSGVEIYERRDHVVHAKNIVIDDAAAIVGSCNLDYRSTEFNLELSAIIRHRAFAQQMTALFANDMANAQQITLSAWKSRPTRDRIVQWAISRGRYVL